MNKSERCHALAVELHSWMKMKDFRTWPEPSIEEIEQEIRDHMELDGPIEKCAIAAYQEYENRRSNNETPERVDYAYAEFQRLACMAILGNMKK